MALIFMVIARQGLAVGKAKPSLCPFQGLDMGLFIHAEDHGILRGVQVEPYDIGCLGSELRVGAETPTSAPLQMNPMPPQGPPHLMGTHIFQALGHQGAGSGGETWGRGLI